MTIGDANEKVFHASQVIDDCATIEADAGLVTTTLEAITLWATIADATEIIFTNCADCGADECGACENI